ncbi:MAG: cache domain-containing protein [Desulfobacterales bacterium]|nr:cache domain-containing protein [Desulfobacterales bacterium]
MKTIKLMITALLVGGLLVASVAVAEEQATKEECVIKSHEAAAYINSKGVEAAIEAIGDANGPFVWKDSYVFLMNMDGKMLAHPFQPELTQKDHVLLHTDPTGKALFVHFVNLARKMGEGWVEYMWPKPGKTSPSKKLSYIYKVPNHDLFVGAGVYVGGMIY